MQVEAIETKKENSENRNGSIVEATATYEDTRKDCQHEENATEKSTVSPTMEERLQQCNNNTGNFSTKDPIFESSSKDNGTSVAEVCIYFYKNILVCKYVNAVKSYV